MKPRITLATQLPGLTRDETADWTTATYRKHMLSLEVGRTLCIIP